MDKLLVASEYTEPSFHKERVLEKLEILKTSTDRFGFLLITKDIAGSTVIWEKAKEMGIPTVTHITITGLGGSQLEPLVPDWRSSCFRMGLFVTRVKNLNTVVLRIDPLIPSITDFSILEQIVESAHSLGITRVRTSVIDYYPFVRDKFSSKNLPHYPGLFQPPPKVKFDILWKLADICIGKYSMSLESCAENVDIPGLEKVGCADREEWKGLGLDLPIGGPVRKECFCNVTKYDLLSHEPYCGHNCLYCYWGKFRR